MFEMDTAPLSMKNSCDNNMALKILPFASLANRFFLRFRLA